MTEPAADEFDADLLRIAGAVSDGRSVDWNKEATTRPDLSDSLRSLQAVASVAQACGSELESEEVPTRWGSLEIRERIGWGTFGEVYRAHDPALQLEVALKLLRPGVRPASEHEILSEARKLARIRHENVLRVYGAAEHEGRFGIWTELVKGSTLEEILEGQGRFGADEAATCGMAICRALAELHRKGIVHRDVKTRNVMREEGGRFVLMDFGSAGDILESGPEGAKAQGTPITMAPEQLYGKKTGPRTDIWGLGVLLYRLLTKRYPIEASSFVELAEKHERRERTPLRDVRTDLSPQLVQVVEKALSFDPDQRFASAGEMERGLANAIGRTIPIPPPRPAVPPVLAAAASILVVLGLMLWHPWRHKPKPNTNLTATVELFREAKNGAERLLSGSPIRPGDNLYLNILGTTTMYVYVLDSDEYGHAYYLYPGPAYDTKGALSAGVPHRLPGTRNGETVNWRVTSPGGKETIVVVASKHPQPEFEQEIASIPAPRLDAPITYQEVSPQALQVVRGIGGLTTSTPKGPDVVTGAMQKLNTDSIAASDFWTWQISLQNP